MTDTLINRNFISLFKFKQCVCVLNWHKQINHKTGYTDDTLNLMEAIWLSHKRTLLNQTTLMTDPNWTICSVRDRFWWIDGFILLTSGSLTILNNLMHMKFHIFHFHSSRLTKIFHNPLIIACKSATCLLSNVITYGWPVDRLL
jgi:hypothetical protein